MDRHPHGRASDVASMPWRRVGIAVVAALGSAFLTSCTQGPPEGATEAHLNQYWDPADQGDARPDPDEVRWVTVEYPLECGQSLNSARVLKETADDVDVAVWIDEGPCDKGVGREVWAATVNLPLRDPLGDRDVTGFGVPLREGFYRMQSVPIDFVDATGGEAESVLDPAVIDEFASSHPWIDVWESGLDGLSVDAVLAALLRPTETRRDGGSVVVVSASDLPDVFLRSDETVDLRELGMDRYRDRFETAVWDAGVDPDSGALVAAPVFGGEFYLVVPAVYEVHDPSFDAREAYLKATAGDALAWIVARLTPAVD